MNDAQFPKNNFFSYFVLSQTSDGRTAHGHVRVQLQ